MSEAARGGPPGPAVRFERVAIVGVGLIGGSLALAARQRGLFGEVVGVGRGSANLAAALARGAVDRASHDLRDGVRDADLIVLAVPVASLEPVAHELAPALAPGAIVTDVGSVKAAVLEPLEGAVGERGRFVGGHPIAGTERSGVAAASPTLFEGRCCVLTPSERTDAGALERVRALWIAVGMRVVDMDAARHDRVLAMVSHLPHAIAYALAGEIAAREVAGEDLVTYSAGGLKDFTRIAASDPALWRDIFLLNRDELARCLAAYRERLARVEALVADGRADELLAELELARSLEARLG